MIMSKKRGKSIKININFSNRWLYTLILIGILAIIAVGVYAATYSPSGAGHPYTEISTCADGQILKMSGGAWICGDDVTGITQEFAELNYKDPPGQWTCTIRQGTGTGTTASASCVGSEKVITGGCRGTSSSLDYLTSFPNQNGWSCYCPYSMCGTMTANAYCCL